MRISDWSSDVCSSDLMAHAADRAGIQFRILNASKGPAVRATRAQADRMLYKWAVREALENQPNLTLFQQEVEDLNVEGGAVRGIVPRLGLPFHPPALGRHASGERRVQ